MSSEPDSSTTPLFFEAAEPPELSGRKRWQTWLNMLFTDHGLIRIFYTNKAQVTANVERRGHPSPWVIRRAARRGIRTILNLRGLTSSGSYLLEQEAAHKAGIRLINFRMHSRRAPSREEIRAAESLFNRVEYPLMMHCKSGADRAGLMAALYLLIHEQRPVAEAKQALGWRYFHIKQSSTGILDYFLEAFEQAQKTAEAEGKPLAFMQWVETQYDPATLERGFKSSRWASWLTDKLLKRE